MFTKHFTVVDSKKMRDRVLTGIWSLRNLIAYVEQEGGDPENFTFTRNYPNGKRDHFTVTEGELKESKPERFFSSDVTCK